MNLQPLEYITPSIIAALSNCFLQAAFRANTTYTTFQPPAVRLGTVCHALLERVASGALVGLRPDSWQDGLEGIWQEEISKQESALLDSEQEKHFGRAETWPKYALQKARVFLRAEKLLTYQYERIQRGQQHSRSTSERPYEAYDGRLRGRADVVYESSQGVELVDYKTGKIYDEDETGDSTIKELYRQQLYLYAAMHRDCTNVWPVLGHIVPLTGQPVTIDIDPLEAERIVQSAMRQMEQFNERISQVKQYTELATPSIASCCYCSYKVYCPSFWQYSFEPSTWGSTAHLDVVVREISQQPRGASTLLLQIIGGTLPNGECICYISRSVNFVEGQRAKFINVQVEERKTIPVLRVHDHTVIYLS